MTKDRRRNMAASVRQRLMNKAREQKEDFGIVLTRYGLERLLYRLSQSSYREQFVLNGAMFSLGKMLSGLNLSWQAGACPTTG